MILIGDQGHHIVDSCYVILIVIITIVNDKPQI